MSTSSAVATPTATPQPGRRAVPHAVRIAFLLICVLVLSWAAVAVVDTDSRVPLVWPAGGIVAGLLLTVRRRWRTGVLLASLVLVLAAFLGNGYDWGTALGFSLSSVGAAWLVRRQLVKDLAGRQATLRDQGDISRLLTAVATGSLLAAGGCALTVWAAGQGSPWLGALAGFGSHAASVMVLLPLFTATLRHAPLSSPRERVLQTVLTVSTTFVIFAVPDLPLLIFAMMPMFAWHAFRGTLREATVLVMVVGVIGSVFTLADAGPIAGLGPRYGLPPEVVGGVLQLFLLDCSLILLPLSVVVTQQRISAARAAAESETLQRVVQSATGTAIIALDRDGLITLFNPGAEAMLGYCASEVLGTAPERFHPAGELPRQAAILGVEPTASAVATAAVAAGEAQLWHFLRRDGDQRVLRMRLTRMPDEHGEPSGFLATAEDVTEREAAHRAMLLTLQHQATAVQRLEELERVKGDFVATVSHELRTPITSIIGYTEVLEDGLVGELSEAQLEVVGRVDRNGRRLLLLVEDLLTLSEIESSSLKIEPVVADIRCVVTNARKALEPVLCTRALRVEVDLPDAPVVHHGDPVQLERMVSNLLTNAVKFTSDGGTVSVSMRSDGETTEIVVRDSGVGISEEDQQKLFTRFFRSATAFEEAIPGTGLGLSIVQAIATLHGGSVSVESRHGAGTTVTARIPRIALGAAAARPVQVGRSAAR